MEKETISSKEMRALETNAEYFGVSLLQLMENAGRSVAQEIGSRFKKDDQVVIFCGLGGNGGDGFVAARHLLSMGFNEVALVLAGKGKDITHEAAKANWLALQPFQSGIFVQEVSESIEDLEFSADIVVDALLGTGSKGKLKAPISGFVSKINLMKAFKLAVDVPTGVDSDSGTVAGDAVRADITVTFHKAKSGFRKAKEFTGKIVVRDIGLPPVLETFAGPGDVQLVSAKRSIFAHKGDAGRVLLVGGSEVFSGAPALMSMAALRTGADIAYTAAPEKIAHDIASMSPDLIVVKLEGDHLNPGNVADLGEYLKVVDAVVVGPGIGMHPETRQFVADFINTVEAAGKPVLLDADGLKAFAEFKRKLKVPLILTPHAGEYAILTGNKLPDDLSERVRYVKQTAAELDAVVLLKGAVDIVSEGRRTKLNFTGNPGMTVGGTGDVLSGVVGALLAQKADAFEAAVAGAFVNGAAGDFAANRVGHHLVATDLLEYLPQVLNDPMSHSKVRRIGTSS